ncbi:MAG TPA: hypothetical protein PLD25_30455 [Chloroflexota bacterium]|nr:hypothetical protein [Chloroflexota bacterium]HUM68181.1 hypothetical protein [Chloroflexota bacterium]
MALLTNDRSGSGYLAVELTIDKRLHPITPFMRGPVASWDVPDEVYQENEALSETWMAEWTGGESDWPPNGKDWPKIDRAKIGWLHCTIKFVVGAAIIYQQSLLVQYTTFWEWYYLLNALTATEHTEDRHLYSGGESPELKMHLVRSYFDAEEWGLDPQTANSYGYSLAIWVDTGIAAGEPEVSGEGPGMFFHPSQEQILAFAGQLLSEADAAG